MNNFYSVQCRECPRRPGFNSPNVLREHLRVVHGINQFDTSTYEVTIPSQSSPSMSTNHGSNIENIISRHVSTAFDQKMRLLEQRNEVILNGMMDTILVGISSAFEKISAQMDDFHRTYTQSPEVNSNLNNIVGQMDSISLSEEDTRGAAAIPEKIDHSDPLNIPKDSNVKGTQYLCNSKI